MKNKFDTIEKEEVLSLHKRHKTDGMILREQAGDLKSQLQNMIDSGQVPDVVRIATLDTSNPNRRFAIVKKSKKNPGKEIYLFADFKYGSFGADGKFVYGKENWTPLKPKQQIINTQFQDRQIDDYKKANNAKTKEEAIASGWNLSPQNVTKTMVDGVELYTQKGVSDIVTGVSQQQKEAIADAKKEFGAKEAHELTGAELKNWQEVPVGDVQRLFPDVKVKLFRPRAGYMNSDSGRYQELRKNYNIDEDTCADLILTYFNDYRTDTPFPDSYFVNEKPKVQFCKNKFHYKWGIRANARKLNKILDLMSREITEFQGVNQPPQFSVDDSTRHLWTLKNI